LGGEARCAHPDLLSKRCFRDDQSSCPYATFDSDVLHVAGLDVIHAHGLAARDDLFRGQFRVEHQFPAAATQEKHNRNHVKECFEETPGKNYTPDGRGG
jgi:hypothetical protein